MNTRLRLLTVLCFLLPSVATIAAPIGATGAPTATNAPSKPELQMFTLPGCTYCRAAKEFMTSKHIPFQEIDMTTTEGAKAAEALDVPLMAPIFAYRNRILRGYTAAKLENFLKD